MQSACLIFAGRGDFDSAFLSENRNFGLDLCELGRKSEYRYIREMQTYLDHCETVDYIP
jgi:hypothetical protein